MIKWLILCSIEENCDVAINQTVWGVKPRLKRVWDDVLRGDIAFFYVPKTIKRIIGVCRVKEKLDPQVYSPAPLWHDEIEQNRVVYSYRFKFNLIHVSDDPLIQGIDVKGLRLSLQQGISHIRDEKTIYELHRRVKLKWNIDVPSPQAGSVKK